jgi:hypothetical protein
MATIPATDFNIASATTGVAPSNLAATIATIQVAVASSRKHATAADIVSQQEQAVASSRGCRQPGPNPRRTPGLL